MAGVWPGICSSPGVTFATSALALLTAAPAETALPADPAPAFFAEQGEFLVSGDPAECAGLFCELLNPETSEEEPMSPKQNACDVPAAADLLAGLYSPVTSGWIMAPFPTERTTTTEELTQLARQQEPAAIVRWEVPQNETLPKIVDSFVEPGESRSAADPRVGSAGDQPQRHVPAFSLLLRPAPTGPSPSPFDGNAVAARFDPAVPSKEAGPAETGPGQPSAPPLVLARTPDADAPFAQPELARTVLESAPLPKLTAERPARPKEATGASPANADEPGGEKPVEAALSGNASTRRPDADESGDGQDDRRRAGGEIPRSALHSGQPSPAGAPSWTHLDPSFEPAAWRTKSMPVPEESRIQHSIAPDSRIEKPLQPVRELVVQLPGQDGRAVEIRFVDRRHAIEVTARTQRQQDAIPLQSNLEQLREKLATHGFTTELSPSSLPPEAEAWLPARESSQPVPRETVVADSIAGQSMPGSAEGRSGGDNQRKRLAAWLNQVEDSLDGHADGDGKEKG